MEISSSQWGEVDGIPVQKYTIKEPSTNLQVELSDFGATLVRVMTADRDGQVKDINFGHNSPELYKTEKGFFGAVVGRVANRIGGATFSLENKEYKLFVNNAGKNTLHGGNVGFNRKMWKLIKMGIRLDVAELVFQYVSLDGEENFPGTLTTELTYRISPSSIGWEFKAETTKTTIINLTNHAYWNLNGDGSLIDDHLIQLDADEYMPVDPDCLVTGEVKSVDKLGIDIRKPKSLAQVFLDFGDVDNNFMLNGYRTKKDPSDIFLAADLYSPRTGRAMQVYTSEPGVQLYTGNFLDGIDNFGTKTKKHNALCLETQRPPNAINLPEFASMTILKPKQTYFHKTVHIFSIR